MTKKELLELEAFKCMPDDTEIVFHTSNEVDRCVPLTPRICYYINQAVVRSTHWSLREMPECKFHSAFVIDAMPRDYLERQHNMTFIFD